MLALISCAVIMVNLLFGQEVRKRTSLITYTFIIYLISTISLFFYVVGKIFLENARGAIGETDEEMLNHISLILAEEPDVKDIQRIEVVKEGEFLHVEVVLEVDSSHTVSYVDDIRDRLMHILLNQKGVQDVVISFDEDDGIRTWTGNNDPEALHKFSSKFPK